MRMNALRARPRRRALPNDSGERTTAAIAANVLDRQFTADQPNRKWIADFTYVWTAEGWLYVAAVIDLFSRPVVGWSMKAKMNARLVTDAHMMAIWRRGLPQALLHHSDRCSQYTSKRFQRLMAENGVACSMRRSGNVWDNAAMESLFASRPFGSHRSKQNGSAARFIEHETLQGPMCSITSSGSTTRFDGTRRSATSAQLSSKGRWG
jgi:putative transposase